MKLTGLDGKTALVTGASKGIGKSIAAVLSESGVRVVCCARNESILIEACSEIEKGGGTALPVKADVSSPLDRRQLIERAISEFGGIDFLINNAGIHMEKEAMELSDEELLQAMEVNFFPMFSLSRDVARQMIPRGGGKIINIGSYWGQLGVPRQVAYCVSKGAVEAMTRCLAVEWARHNIQVNTVAPGHIMTDISKAAMENEKLRNIILRRIPARRVGEPEEVGYLVAFLCSQESNYITGHIYYIDGGQLISW
jgi:NAD(P)-dependent dehydrogenase (short-subunit alcohol dehydrogenase family)